MKRTLARLRRPQLARSQLDTFYIQLDDPHKNYAPGEAVCGEVVLILPTNQPVKWVACKLVGTIRVRGFLGKKRQHDDSELFADEIVLWDDATGSSPLQQGEHLFAYEFMLPTKGLYNSLEFERGSISYMLEATASAGTSSGANSSVGATSWSLATQKNISVVVPIDVAALSIPRPASLSIDVRKKWAVIGSIAVSMDTPARGYLRGEQIPVKITVRHIKPVRSMTGVVVTLSRISRMQSETGEPQTFRKDIAQTIQPLITDPSSHLAVVATSIRVPPETFPTTRGHRLVSFEYCIEAVVDLTGAVKMDPKEQKIGFVDTDKLSARKGVVNLWIDLVVGTNRASPRTKPASISSDSSPHMANAGADPAASTGRLSIWNDDDDSVSFGTPEPVYRRMALSEKERQRLYEQAVTASEPVYDEVVVTPSAPEPMVPPASAPVLDNHTPDKLEIERLRLQDLESAPDYVPAYSAPGPSTMPAIPVPSAPLDPDPSSASDPGSCASSGTERTIATVPSDTVRSEGPGSEHH